MENSEKNGKNFYQWMVFIASEKDAELSADDYDEILNRAIEGDLEAFSLLYEEYIHKIYNYIYYRIGNHHDAEDLTARVFYRALGHIRDFTPKGVPFSAWLYRIAHNLVANWYRDKSRKKEISLEEYFETTSNDYQLEKHLMQAQEDELLLKAIRSMGAERQQLLILKLVEGLSNSEIGLIMGRSEGAIKSLYHRTLKSLRRKIEKIQQE